MAEPLFAVSTVIAGEPSPNLTLTFWSPRAWTLGAAVPEPFIACSTVIAGEPASKLTLTFWSPRAWTPRAADTRVMLKVVGAVAVVDCEAVMTTFVGRRCTMSQVPFKYSIQCSMHCPHR